MRGCLIHDDHRRLESMDEGQYRRRGAIKFVFWAVAAAIVVTVCVRSYVTGQMSAWFYHRASADGYAVNADSIQNATKANPAILRVVAHDSIEGLTAVRVAKGDRLPRNANGVIGAKILEQGKRAVVEGDTIRVLVPWEIQQAKGIKFKDSFKHKGIATWPWAALWNVVIVGLLGLSLGLMAEGFTDLMGLKLAKLEHHVGH
jgi:hypothetical protein